MADLAAAAAFGAYRLAGLAALPVVPLILSRRAARGKEDRLRLPERYGRASLPRPAGHLVWVHAASVGETNAVVPLVRRIVERGRSVVFTCVTVTAAKTAAATLPAGAVHQYAPVDISPFVGRFLGHWRPDAALFVESELWPATMLKLASSGVPQILVNAHLSERSLRGWQRFGRVAQSLFAKISLCLAQSREDGERYVALGTRDVRFTGNIKLDAPPLHADPAAVNALRAAIAGRPVWGAASTHEGEEEVVASADHILRERHPGLLTMIAPRHPSRGAQIAAMLASRGFTIARRSIGEPLTPGVQIYLADTLGELGLFYRAAPIAFIGGTVAPRGGHNPIEPVRLGTAVLHGPHVHNVAELYAALDRAVGSEPIRDGADLARAVGVLLDTPAVRDRQAAEALAALTPFTGALDKTMLALSPYLGGEPSHV